MMKYKKQELFPKEKTIWEKEWQGMPEFCIENKPPFKELRIKFDTPEDYKLFAKMIRQPLSMKTISIWFPCHPKESRREWRFVNEEE